MATDTEPSSLESATKELHAYNKLLNLRSGLQYEDKSLYPELDDEAFADQPGNDGDSSKNAPLGSLDLDCLRREFLDRLSETVSSMKGGKHVVASQMFYWPDKVKVFIAINSKFVKDDNSFLGDLCTALKEIAAVTDSQAEEYREALWDMVLRRQSSRLNEAIANVRQTLKKYQLFVPQQSPEESTSLGVVLVMNTVVLDFEDSLKLLAKLLFSDGSSEREKHRHLVSLSHAIYRSFPAEQFQALGKGGDKLRRDIGFLGRLRKSFDALVAAASQIPGFEDLSLIPVVGPKNRKKPPRREWTLVETFQALNLQLSDEAVTKLMGRSNSKSKWTKTRLNAEFSGKKSPTWEVHAEILLIVFILNNPDQVSNGKRFDYIGCTLKTRGCHGKLYDRSWTLPSGDSLGKDEQQLLLKPTKKIISWMLRELTGNKRKSAQKRAEVKESTIGGSLAAIPGLSRDDNQRSYAASEHLQRQRAENSYARPRE